MNGFRSVDLKMLAGQTLGGSAEYLMERDIPSRALELQIIQYPKLVCSVMCDWVTTPRLV